MFFFERFLNLGQSNFQTGIVSFNDDLCTGCKNCEAVCPATAIEVVNKKAKMIPGTDCIGCAACEAVCSTESIRLTRFFSVPSGAYQTIDKNQSLGADSFPRIFKEA